MLSPVTRQSEMTMACGHHEWHMVKYRGTRDLRAIKSSYRFSVCAECSKRISFWNDNSGFDTEIFPMRLPELRGQSEAQIRYATDIRNRQWKAVSPLLFSLVKDESDLAITLWRAVVIRFMITSGPYWLRNKRPIGHNDLVMMVVDVMNPPVNWRPSSNIDIKNNSAYKQLKIENPALLARVLDHNPVGMFSKATA